MRFLPRLACCLALLSGPTHAADDEPPWLPRTLAIASAKLPVGTPVLDARVMTGDRGQLFLAIVWQHGLDDAFNQRFELHRVTVRDQDRVSLTLMRAVEEHSLNLEWPLDGKVFAGEAPVIALETDAGGMGWFNTSLRLFQLTGDSIEITPRAAGQLIELRDLNGDGSFELLARDVRWGNLFAGCSRCGPLIAIVLERHDGEFRPACRRFAEQYDLPDLSARGISDWQHSELLAQAALVSAQLGLPDRAEAFYQDLEQWVQVVAPLVKEGPSRLSPVEQLESARTNVAPMIAEAATRGDVACPLSAAGQAEMGEDWPSIDPDFFRQPME